MFGDTSEVLEEGLKHGGSKGRSSVSSSSLLQSAQRGRTVGVTGELATPLWGAASDSPETFVETAEGRRFSGAAPRSPETCVETAEEPGEEPSSELLCLDPCQDSCLFGRCSLALRFKRTDGQPLDPLELLELLSKLEVLEHRDLCHTPGGPDGKCTREGSSTPGCACCFELEACRHTATSGSAANELHNLPFVRLLGLPCISK